MLVSIDRCSDSGSMLSRREIHRGDIPEPADFFPVSASGPQSNLLWWFAREEVLAVSDLLSRGYARDNQKVLALGRYLSAAFV